MKVCFVCVFNQNTQVSVSSEIRPDLSLSQQNAVKNFVSSRTFFCKWKEIKLLYINEKKKIKCFILVNMYRKQSDCTEQWRVCSVYAQSCLLCLQWSCTVSILGCAQRALYLLGQILQCCGGATYLTYGNKGFVKAVLTSVLVSIAV